MFPLGFECLIPNEAKLNHTQKRLRKLQKKKKKKTFTQSNLPPPTPSTITSSDVISLATELGLKIDGPISCIENLISAIPKRQQADWDASLA